MLLGTLQTLSSLPPPCRIGMVCAFATNQYTHSQTGPSVKAVPQTLLSLRGLVSDVPEVSTIQALICE